jgi:hypothetical protein
METGLGVVRKAIAHGVPKKLVARIFSNGRLVVTFIFF